ncbi:non-ltr retroelement reverse transcriptase [Gossypium australe]|uniref:Non-ltr retroelement reverse transcriptase n=1 Tax=Gossypium australe TaxID=47621 RepID=A0A5B6X5W9_9ROSI|nr:non-ltr retroelement reverse transcriptase [Gossypium australe]
MVFLMETKLSQKSMEKVRRSCGFINDIDIDAEGSRGGLSLAWKSDFGITLRSFSKWHIDVLVNEDVVQKEWRFTGFYGSLYLNDSNLTWTTQTIRGLPRGQKRMDAFRETLEECKLMDIGYSGVWFTWEKGNLPETNIRERLDRGVANEEWLLLFPMVKVQHLPYSTSDHCPIFINTDTLDISIGHRRQKKGLKERLTKELEILVGQERDEETLAKIIDTKIHLNMEIDKDKIYWEQRARANWLQLDLFASKGIGSEQRALEGIQKSITQEINEVLLSSFKEEDVWSAVKGIGPMKALGWDGFPALFFQKYWHIVGKEVGEFCLRILNENERVDSINVTEIVLIPKIPNPSSLVNFRPISLCSVIYKIVAKAVANRLQNVIGKKGYMAVKLDMSKAYDRVEWDFVKKMMIQMGFAREWVGLIMRCISSVSYAVNINGNRGRIFQTTRGLKQGDPLSPFLFIICSEGLSSLMRSAKKDGLVKGAKASRRGPEISHLLFADDCMMFGEATKQGAKNMKDILKEYESCSGQCVNFNKSTIFYSSNTTVEAKEVVSSLLGVRSSSSPEKYLGLPNVVGKRKKEAFQSILDKITLRIESWSTSSKEEGGLGFRSMAQFNIALLAKQGWRLMVFPNSLVARVFKAKYFPEGDFRFSRLGRTSSFVWRSIWASKDALESGLFWKVGTGENISVFDDAWIPNYDNVRLTVGVGNSHFVKVVELIKSNEREWNRDLICNTFPKDEAELILRIPLAMAPHENLLAWRGKLSGEFSVRSSYKPLQDFDPTAYALHNNYGGFYNKLWRIDIPTKIKIFIWKISWNFLATRVNLALRKITFSRLCPRCAAGEESMNHLFRDCPVSVAIWSDLSNSISITNPQTEFIQWLTMGMATLSLNKCRFLCVTLWAIWGDRNSRIHEKTNRSSQEIAGFFHRYIKELEGIRTINQNSSKRAVEWKTPSEQILKINFDASFEERSKESASGVVVRDCDGSVLLTSTDLHTGVDSSFVAEALACRRATQTALEMNSQEVIIEGDSLSIIKKCNNRVLDKSQVSSYIHDIQGMKDGDKTVRFEFVQRSANKLAHILATETLKRKEKIYLVGGVPWFAEPQAIEDFAREPD